jgi:hypothetical protein
MNSVPTHPDAPARWEQRPRRGAGHHRAAGSVAPSLEGKESPGQARQCGLAQSWLTGPALGDSATARNDLHDGFLVGPRHPDTSSCPHREAIGAEVEARIDGQCHIPTQHEVRLFDIERPNEAGVESGSTSSSNRLRKASRALRVRVGLSCVLAQDVSVPSLLSSESSSGASSSNPTGLTFHRQTGAITPVSRSEGRSEVPGAGVLAVA